MDPEDAASDPADTRLRHADSGVDPHAALELDPDLATCPLADIDAFSSELLQDPHPYFARLRAEAPVFRDPRTGIVSVSTYELILEVNRQPLVFSNDFSAQLRSGSTQAIDEDEAAILAQGWPVANTMLTADPPAHTRYRKLAMKAFTYKRVEGMGPYMAQVTSELLDGFAPDGGCEFKRQFANHLPMIVIADALGVPRADMDSFHRWSDAFVVQLGGVSDKATRLEAARRVVEFQRYFVGVIEDKRARPTDDVISDLVHADLAEEGDSRKMDHSELLSILQQLLVAGNETTAHSLTAGLYYLISNPAEMARVRADPELIPGLVEETLRYLTPSNNMWRVATRDAEIGGVPVKAGEMILVRYGSANRDAAHFADPDRFDVGRPDARSHLAFGAGIHTCIGAQLARKEMVTAFPLILDRLRNLRFAEGANAFRYSPNVLLRGVEALHLAFDPRVSGAIHHASLTTDDLDRLRGFYERHFGFSCVLETAWDGGNPVADAIYGIPDTSVRMAMLKRGTSFLEIFEFRRPAAARSADRQVCTAGFTHIALLTDDIDGDFRRLGEAGVPFNCPPQDVPGLCLATYARDPDGNLIELLQPHPGGPFAP